MWLSLLISQMRKRYGQCEMPQQGRAKVAAGETEGILVQIGLEVFLGQTMISAQDKRLCVADHDVQPMEEARIGIVGFVFMGVAIQGQNVVVIAIAVGLTAIGEGSMSKFFHRCLLDIECYPHFQKAGIASFLQRQCYENLHPFCAPTPLFPCCRAFEVRIVQFDNPAQLLGFIPLAHGGANTPEYGSCGFVGAPSITASCTAGMPHLS